MVVWIALVVITRLAYVAALAIAVAVAVADAVAIILFVALLFRPFIDGVISSFGSWRAAWVAVFGEMFPWFAMITNRIVGQVWHATVFKFRIRVTCRTAVSI